MLVFGPEEGGSVLKSDRRWSMSYDNKKIIKKIKNKLELHR